MHHTALAAVFARCARAGKCEDDSIHQPRLQSSLQLPSSFAPPTSLTEAMAPSDQEGQLSCIIMPAHHRLPSPHMVRWHQHMTRLTSACIPWRPLNHSTSCGPSHPLSRPVGHHTHCACRLQCHTQSDTCAPPTPPLRPNPFPIMQLSTVVVGCSSEVHPKP